MAASIPRIWILLKLLLFLPASLGAAQQPSAPAPSSVEVVVRDGAPVEVELKTGVSSRDAEKGSVLQFTVVRPVDVGGVIVVAAGARAQARVVDVIRAGRTGRSGRLTVQMEHAEAVDGSLVPLRFAAQVGQRRGKPARPTVQWGDDPRVIVLLSPALVLHKAIKTGGESVLPAGERFEVYVHGNARVKVNPALERIPPPNAPQQEKLLGTTGTALPSSSRQLAVRSFG